MSDLRVKGDIEIAGNYEVKKKGTFDARHLVPSFAALLAFTKANYIPKGFFVSVVDDDDTLAGIYRCLDDNLSDTPANNASKWKLISEASGNAAPANGAQSADYVLSVKAGIVKAIPADSAWPVYTDASVSVVMNAVLAKLHAQGGGSAYLNSGRYPQTGPIIISGAATERPPKDQIKITGAGFNTVFVQNTADQHGIILKNRASICFRDFRVDMGNGMCGILGLVPDGTDEPSIFGGVMENIFVYNESSTWAPIDISNQFDLHMQTVFAFNTGINATAVRIQQVGDKFIRFGNSSIGFLRTFTKAGGTGLHLKGINQYRPINLMQFNNYEFAPYGEGAARGVFLEGASNCTFVMSDIEYCKYPVWLDNVAGDNSAQSINNRFLSGYLYPQGAGARAITVNNASSGGNDFACKIETDDSSTALVLDKMSFSNANRYDLILGYSASHTGDNIKIESPNNVLLTVRPLLTDVFTTVPTPAQGDVSKRPVNTEFLAVKSYLNKASADEQYLNRYGSNAQGRLGVDVWGLAGNTERVDGALADLKNIGQDNIIQGVALGEDYKLKGFTPFAWRIFLGLQQSAFYDYQPAKADSQFFTNATTQTQPIYDNSAYLATTAFTRLLASVFFTSINVADAGNYAPTHGRELIVFEGGVAQKITIVAAANLNTEFMMRNGNTSGNVTINFGSGNKYEGQDGQTITLAPGEFVWITYAYTNNWRLVYKAGSSGSSGAESDPVFAAQGEKKSNKVSAITGFSTTEYPSTKALGDFLTTYYTEKGTSLNRVSGMSAAPASSTSAGSAGDVYIDSLYFYYYAQGRWRRILNSNDNW